MRRAAWLVIALALAAVRPAAAQNYYREELRIPMEAAGPRGLEALLIRPAGSGPYPLALLSHGAPREASDRAGMSANGLYRQGVEFARRGFASLIVMRRGYGSSGGSLRGKQRPLRQSRLSAHRPGIRKRSARRRRGDEEPRSDVDDSGFIAVGVSAGGFATVALTADPPPGLAAAISFAGGRGSRADNDVCDEDSLVRAFATLGRTSRIPMLWIYAAERQVLRA